MKESECDKAETKFLVDGFKYGFDLGYRGPENIKIKSENLKFRIGNDIELWNKVMKEVKNKRYAGPFEEIPFENYIQSPLGLVPKDGGKATRLIFHLSYPRVKIDNETSTSVNANTPEYMKKVKYHDIDDAIKRCMEEGVGCMAGKSDFSSAFRHFGLNPKFWKFLVMKAKHPKNGKIFYFVDKCMPFGAAISCSHFQRFSNAVAHIFRFKTGKEAINYLDDYFFVAICEMLCNQQMTEFLKICSQIRFPVSLEKTFWASTIIVFLGFLLDTVKQTISIPQEKINKALILIDTMLHNNRKKTTLLELQSLCGLLNFFSRGIIPARAFTRRLYAATKGALKPHHHINITGEMKLDLKLWRLFLNHPSAYCRPFMDLTSLTKSDEINFYTDVSRNFALGCGGVCEKSWYAIQWDPLFMQENSPSINYLELYALVTGVLCWIHRYENRRVVLFCDNMSVVYMVNSNTSKCKNCMILIRILVLHSLMHNVRVFAKYVKSKDNYKADLLSRAKFNTFIRKVILNEGYDRHSTKIPEQIWPMSKIYVRNTSKRLKNKENLKC